MSRGLGRVELAILRELRQGSSHSIGILSLAVSELKGIGLISLPCEDAAWQSTARAVRSLVKKGLIVGLGGEDGGQRIFVKVNRG